MLFGLFHIKNVRSTDKFVVKQEKKVNQVRSFVWIKRLTKGPFECSSFHNHKRFCTIIRHSKSKICFFRLKSLWFGRLHNRISCRRRRTEAKADNSIRETEHAFPNIQMTFWLWSGRNRIIVTMLEFGDLRFKAMKRNGCTSLLPNDKPPHPKRPPPTHTYG